MARKEVRGTDAVWVVLRTRSRREAWGVGGP